MQTPKKQHSYIQPDTPLKLIAIHKITFKEYTKTITFKEWQEFQKDKNFYYKTVQII